MVIPMTHSPYSLVQLLSLNGPDFVAAAYELLLGRPADPEGMAYYVARLRVGYSKMSVLHQLASGETNDAHRLPGLGTALSRYRMGRTPLLGWFFRKLWRAEGETVHERLQRAIVSELAALQAEICGLDSGGFAQREDPRRASRPRTGNPPAAGRRTNLVAEHLSPRAREIFERLTSS